MVFSAVTEEADDFGFDGVRIVDFVSSQCIVLEIVPDVLARVDLQRIRSIRGQKK